MKEYPAFHAFGIPGMPHVVQLFRRTKMKRNNSCRFQIVLHLEMNCGFYSLRVMGTLEKTLSFKARRLFLHQVATHSGKWKLVFTFCIVFIDFKMLISRKNECFLRGKKLEDCQRKMELLKGLTEYNQVACNIRKKSSFKVA